MKDLFTSELTGKGVIGYIRLDLRSEDGTGKYVEKTLSIDKIVNHGNGRVSVVVGRLGKEMCYFGQVAYFVSLSTKWR